MASSSRSPSPDHTPRGSLDSDDSDDIIVHRPDEEEEEETHRGGESVHMGLLSNRRAPRPGKERAKDEDEWSAPGKGAFVWEILKEVCVSRAFLIMCQ